MNPNKKIVAQLEEQIQKLKQSAPRLEQTSSEANVAGALKVYDDLEFVIHHPDARKAIPGVLDKINFRLWLNFADGKKGNRSVRILRGGIVTTGDAPDPIARYGQGVGECHHQAGSGVSPGPVGNFPPPVDPVSHPEGVSLRMFNRGDKTPVELFAAAAVEIGHLMPDGR